MASTYNEYNPIRKVAKYDSNGNIGSYTYVPVPSKYQYDLQDVSSPDAGRTEDGTMYKELITQKVKVELAWSNRSKEDVSEILTDFNAEYLSIEYLDAMTGNYQTKKFYVGDRTSPLYNSKSGVWENVAFNIIEV